MGTEKEIKIFDALEKNDFSKNGNKALLKSISALDSFMKNQPIEEVSPNFSKHLLADVLKLKSTSNRMLWLLGLIFLPIILISIAIVYFSTGVVDNPIYITQIVERFYSLLQLISDPKVKQLFLICEGIILLVIIEKVVSSFNRRAITQLV